MILAWASPFKTGGICDMQLRIQYVVVNLFLFNLENQLSEIAHQSQHTENIQVIVGHGQVL